MLPVFVLLVIFGSVFGSVTALRYMKHKERMRQLEIEAQSRQPPALMAGAAEREERLRHLEEIVSSVDFELNAKLNRLASQQAALGPSAGADGAEPPRAGMAMPGVLTPGQQVGGRFTIERSLGAGGMGAVYLARDAQLGEQVALKIVSGMAVLDPSANERFRREAAAARRISHPNVVRIHDIGQAEGALFLSMEYVAGESLDDLVKRQGALTVDQTKRIVASLCDGLDAAHSQGVVHRDLKPGNVLLGSDGSIKIIDFGLARLPNLEGMTTTGMLMGTPEYMAPEQMRNGQTIDARADLYALGAVAYRCLAGRAPFEGDNPIAVSLSALTDEAQAISPQRADVSADWDAFIGRALAKNPAHRFTSAAEMKAALP